jgi:hypothetical protein
VAVDDGGRDVGELGVGPARLVAQHLEGVSVVDRMTLHQDALGSLGDHSAAERALEVVVLGEPAEHDVYGALPLLDVGVGDEGEDSALRGLLDEGGSGAWIRRITGHAASFDPVDQGEGMLRALSETDQRDFGSLPGGYGSDVLDVDLAGITSCPRFATIGATSASRSLRSLAISTRRCSIPAICGFGRCSIPANCGFSKRPPTGRLRRWVYGGRSPCLSPRRGDFFRLRHSVGVWAYRPHTVCAITTKR